MSMQNGKPPLHRVDSVRDSGEKSPSNSNNPFLNFGPNRLRLQSNMSNGDRTNKSSDKLNSFQDETPRSDNIIENQPSDKSKKQNPPVNRRQLSSQGSHGPDKFTEDERIDLPATPELEESDESLPTPIPDHMIKKQSIDSADRSVPHLEKLPIKTLSERVIDTEYKPPTSNRYGNEIESILSPKLRALSPKFSHNIIQGKGSAKKSFVGTDGYASNTSREPLSSSRVARNENGAATARSHLKGSFKYDSNTSRKPEKEDELKKVSTKEFYNELLRGIENVALDIEDDDQVDQIISKADKDDVAAFRILEEKFERKYARILLLKLSYS